MKNGSGPKGVQIAIPKGATKTDLRLTKHPADTPRGRLHRLAAATIRAVDEVRQHSGISRDDMLWLRDLARRGLALVPPYDEDGSPTTVGQQLVREFCHGLDSTIFSLILLDVDAVAKLCEGLTLTLVQLEVAENTIRDLQAKLEASRQDTRSARSDVEQLRTLLAAAHTSAAKKEAETDEFRDEPTRRQEVPPEQLSVIHDPDAR